MDLFDHFGAGKHEKFVVALHVFGVVFEAVASKIGFLETEALDHGAHRAVDDEDAFAKSRFEEFCPIAGAHVRVSRSARPDTGTR